MFNLETRKKNTTKIIIKTEKLLKKITNNNKIAGFIIFFSHWLLLGIALLYILIGKINSFFYFSSLIWIIVFIMHFYFNGCIATRIERHLWDTKKWFGPWMLGFIPLEKLGVEITRNLANNIYICWGFLLLIFIFFKILYYLK